MLEKFVPVAVVEREGAFFCFGRSQPRRGSSKEAGAGFCGGGHAENIRGLNLARRLCGLGESPLHERPGEKVGARALKSCWGERRGVEAELDGRQRGGAGLLGLAEIFGNSKPAAQRARRRAACAHPGRGTEIGHGRTRAYFIRAIEAKRWERAGGRRFGYLSQKLLDRGARQAARARSAERRSKKRSARRK